MQIQVLLFASLRERFGQASLQLDLDSATSVGGVWEQISGNNKRLPDRVLCAVNQQFADHDAVPHSRLSCDRPLRRQGQ